jgi:hypothetical protein
VIGMPSSVGVIAACGVALGLVLAPQSQSPAQSAPAPPAATPGMDHFAGAWEYNPAESVNAYTGKPEQGLGNAPRSAANRPSGGSGSGGGQPGSTGSGNPGGATGLGGGSGTAGQGGQGGYGPPGGYGSGYGGSGGGDDFAGAYRGWAAAWARSAARDLLEVPWAYLIQVKPESVTFTDDLKRARTYPTDGKRTKFQLGAAVFHAKTFWDGPRLRKEIDATGSFKMLETYFLSEDASRLFVIIRVGDPKKVESKTAPLSGVNRVYDRVR